jgi:acyl transferase domain-containing protein
VINSLRHPDDQSTDRQFLLTAVGRLWLAGVAIDWETIRNEPGRRRLPLPTYPFERQRYWIEPGETTARVRAAASVP